MTNFDDEIRYLENCSEILDKVSEELYTICETLEDIEATLQDNMTNVTDWSEVKEKLIEIAQAVGNKSIEMY